MENGDVELKIGSDTKKLSVASKDGSVKLNGQTVNPMSLSDDDRDLLKVMTSKLKALEEAISSVDPSPGMYPAIFGRRNAACPETPSRSNFTLATNFTSLVDRSSPADSPLSVADCRRDFGVGREVHVDGIGVGRPLAGGGVYVQFYDKTQLSVPAAGHKRVTFTDRHGIRTEYPEGARIPLHVRQRLEHLPRVIEMLR